MTDRSELDHILRFQKQDAVFIFPLDIDRRFQVNFTEVNDVATTMLGYTRDDFLSMHVGDILLKTDYPPNRFQRLFQDEFARTEVILIGKDDRRIYTEVNIYAVTVNGTLMGVAVCRDITERRRDEAERRLNEQRFRALYQLSRMIDEPEQAILDFTLEESVSMTESTIGYIYFVSEDETELILHAWSKNVMEECAVKDIQTVYKTCDTGLWGDALRQRQPIITNNYPAHPGRRGQPEGHVPVLRHMNLPVMDEGRIVIIAGVGNKEEEYNETDVLHLSLIMDGMWQIIRRKRMEEALVTARKEAEKANEAKSQFLANMSHELRTPLNGIQGMTQILMATDVTPDQHEYLSLSLEASRHLTKVVTDLLALSSIESGGVELVPTEFNLHETLKALVKPMALQAADKSLALSYAIAPDVPSCFIGDVGKIRQVLINLLFNAIKFTNAGEVALEVTRVDGGNGSDSHCTLAFAVSDTGIGIPDSQLETIFESFTLGESYMTKEFGGTGLGLSISRQLAEIMDARITVESTCGKGSTFTMTLPIKVVEKRAQAPDSPHEQVARDLAPLHILLAEDEQINSIMASRLLRKAGHHVTTVGNGQQAIDALTRDRFDLVLMDVQMPVVNGLQATQIIRCGGVENVPRELPIIGLTAYARSTERNQFLEAGMNRIVTKPYDADELMLALTEVMRQPR